MVMKNYFHRNITVSHEITKYELQVCQDNDNLDMNHYMQLLQYDNQRCIEIPTQLFPVRPAEIAGNKIP